MGRGIRTVIPSSAWIINYEFDNNFFKLFVIGSWIDSGKILEKFRNSKNNWMETKNKTYVNG